MKRGRPLERKKALTVDPAKVKAFADRGRRPLPGDPEKRRAFVNQRSELAAESPKRKAERPERERVRKETRERVAHRCAGAELWPEVECWGSIDVDEKVSRGVRPGAHLDDRLTQALCRGHHEARHRHPAEARRRGLRWRSTDVDADGNVRPDIDLEDD